MIKTHFLMYYTKQLLQKFNKSKFVNFTLLINLKITSYNNEKLYYNFMENNIVSDVNAYHQLPIKNSHTTITLMSSFYISILQNLLHCEKFIILIVLFQ